MPRLLLVTDGHSKLNSLQFFPSSREKPKMPIFFLSGEKYDKRIAISLELLSSFQLQLLCVVFAFLFLLIKNKIKRQELIAIYHILVKIPQDQQENWCVHLSASMGLWVLISRSYRQSPVTGSAFGSNSPNRHTSKKHPQ